MHNEQGRHCHRHFEGLYRQILLSFICLFCLGLETTPIEVFQDSCQVQRREKDGHEQEKQLQWHKGGQSIRSAR